MAIITEHWRRADETIEHVELQDSGNVICVFVKDGEAIIFPSLWNFVMYNVCGQDQDRVYCDEEDLMSIYQTFGSFIQLSESPEYNYVPKQKEERVYLAKGNSYKRDGKTELETTNLYDEEKKAYYFIK